MKIEDYGLISDLQTAALVSRNGSIDWSCFPRFDSGACFAALLGDDRHGRWSIAPADEVKRSSRRYREGTLVLETELETDDGVVRLVDFMPLRREAPDLVRIVEGIGGCVPMKMELVIRFDYGSIVPWVRRDNGTLLAIAGPDALYLRTPVETHGEDMRTRAEFTIADGDSVPFALTWSPSHRDAPKPVDPPLALRQTESWWKEWSARCNYKGEWEEAVRTSLMVLKALTYEPTGGIVAAPTASLPERLGGVRNWDYRYCWLRDATFSLYALLLAGYTDEARAWRDWLLRTVAGDPARLQIMYGAAGERRLTELEIDWLPGYERSRPVRVGNAAVNQFQLDVYGEIADALHLSRRAGIESDPFAWELQLVLLDFLESAWDEPDDGIWEIRGEPQHFTHSKVMAWVAFDRGVKACDRYGLEGPVERWKQLREEIHREVLEKGYDPERGAFVQHYGSKHLDASLLLIPLVGFLPCTDERVVGTVEAIRRELCDGDFVMRYTTDDLNAIDGLPPGEAAFLPCSFWLADNFALAGRAKEARCIFERMLSVRNDLGLLSEEYDLHAGRLVGNFPQAFSHVGLVNTAHNLTTKRGAAHHRSSHD